MEDKIQCTVITSDNGDMTKHITLEDGVLKKQAFNCKMWIGSGEVKALNGLNEFSDLIQSLTSNQAIVHGVPKRDDLPTNFKIVSEKNFTGQPDTITRTKSEFEYSTTHNFLVMIDHDPPENQHSFNNESLIEAISKVIPPFKDACKLITCSTSSCISDSQGNVLSDEGSGKHIYTIFKSGSDIQRFKNIFKIRVWLNGYGYIKIDKTGSLLERNVLFDDTVFKPERIDFVAGAKLQEGLQQHRPQPFYIEGNIFDPSVLPAISEEEERQYKQMVKDAKDAKRDEAKLIQAKYIEDKAIEQFSKRNPSDNRNVEDFKRKVSESVISKNGNNTFDLYGDFELYLDSYPDPITVDEILDNPEKYDKETLNDPHEPDIEVDKAKIYMNIGSGKGKPFIHSFAHGEKKYFLHYSKQKQIEKAEEIIKKGIENKSVSDSNFIDAYILLQKEAPEKAESYKTEIVKKKIIRAKAFKDIVQKRKDILSTEYEDIKRIIEQFNKNHAAITIGGHFQILNEEIDPIYKWKTFTLSQVKNFHERYSNEIMTDPKNPEKIMKASRYWADSKDRREYKGLIFDPSNNDPDYYNIFQGFGVVPKQGDWSKMKYHLKHIVCRGNEEEFNWLFAWYANLFQHPGVKHRTCICFRGKQGAGKNIFIDAIGKCFGKHYKALTKEEELTGRFNEHFTDCLFLFANEVIGMFTPKQLSVLKGLITDDMMAIEAKYRATVMLKNLLNINLAGNENFIIPAALDERRFQIFELSDEGLEKGESYFEDLGNEISNGGIEAMMFDMLNTEVSHINVNKLIRNQSLLNAKIDNFNSLESYWFNRLIEGEVFYSTEFKFEGDWDNGDILVVSIEHHKDYLNYCAENSIKELIKENKFGSFFIKIGFKKPVQHRNVNFIKYGYKTKDGRASIRTLPNLQMCREKFAEYIKTPMSDIEHFRD
ncbi:MAG: hypothetical protein HQK63_14555 [Desulfamplus sp.]|nr:hypothetical protein [Desulfamplus sp.]